MYKNKDWLYDQYWNQGKSLREMGKLCNKTKKTIQYWMDKYEIPRRETSKRYNEKYTNKDWLYEQYCELKKSIGEIAKEINVNQNKILYWMDKYNIPRRTIGESNKIFHSKNKKLYHDKQWLYDQYWNQNKSTVEIGKECNVTSGTIRRWMEKLKIKRRTNSEANKGRIPWNRGIKMPAKYSGKNHPSWNGGRFETKDGYILIYNPDHPRARKSSYVLEHIIIAEKMLGRHLEDDEIVHHIDGDRSNNKPENLYISKNQSKHRKIHASLTKLLPILMKKPTQVFFDREKEEYYIKKMTDVEDLLKKVGLESRPDSIEIEVFRPGKEEYYSKIEITSVSTTFLTDDVGVSLPKQVDDEKIYDEKIYLMKLRLSPDKKAAALLLPTNTSKGIIDFAYPSENPRGLANDFRRFANFIEEQLDKE